MTPLSLSVLLSLLSALCYASAAIVQERLASATAPSRLGLLRSGRWWLAAALQGSGALLHVVALGLGPLTVVQPLGVLTLVLAAPMAAVVIGRPMTAAAWRGIALVSVGLAGILLLTGSSGSRSLDGAQQATLAVTVLASVALLGLAARALRAAPQHPRPDDTAAHGGGRGPVLRGVFLATAAGVAYGTGSVFVKTVAEEADGLAGASLLRAVPLVLLIAVLAAAGLATSQASYRGSGLAVPLATATVTNPVVAAAVGIAVLGEGFRYGLLGALSATVAGALAAWGLFVLSADSTRDGKRTARDAGSPGGTATGTGAAGSGDTGGAADGDDEQVITGPGAAREGFRPVLIPAPAPPSSGPAQQPPALPRPADPAPGGAGRLPMVARP